jgi:hypothetical protein
MALAVISPVIPKGLKNGALTPCQLAPVYLPGHGLGSLHPVTVRAWNVFATMCHVETGAMLTAVSLGDCYRSYDAQLRVFNQRYTSTYLPVRNVLTDRRTAPDGTVWFKRAGVVAVASPGTSNHGLGIAIDCAIWDGTKVVGITSNSKVWAWVKAHAVEYGFSWEGSKPDAEPWHLRHVWGDTLSPKALDVEKYLQAVAA